MFTDIIQQSGIIDGRFLKLSDVDLEFIATNSGGNDANQDKRLNPDRHLVRPEFMEAFVRIGLQKYYKSKIVNT